MVSASISYQPCGHESASHRSPGRREKEIMRSASGLKSAASGPPKCVQKGSFRQKRRGSTRARPTPLGTSGTDDGASVESKSNAEACHTHTASRPPKAPRQTNNGIPRRTFRLKHTPRKTACPDGRNLPGLKHTHVRFRPALFCSDERDLPRKRQRSVGARHQMSAVAHCSAVTSAGSMPRRRVAQEVLWVQGPRGHPRAGPRVCSCAPSARGSPGASAVRRTC